jgi:hypothetical protein
MSAHQGTTDRVEREAQRGEAADAVMILDYDRGASQSTPDGMVRCRYPTSAPSSPAGRRAGPGGEGLRGLLEYLVQPT